MKNKSEEYQLPQGWKKAVSKAHGNKAYFINEKTKETTWIDPRDIFWKKKTWEECESDEIPYGWEISEDPVIGRYFIDHINKRNLIDDPRSAKPKEQLKVVQDIIKNKSVEVESKTRTLKLKKEEMRKLKEALVKESGENVHSVGAERSVEVTEKAETSETSEVKGVSDGISGIIIESNEDTTGNEGVNETVNTGDTFFDASDDASAKNEITSTDASANNDGSIDTSASASAITNDIDAPTDASAVNPKLQKLQQELQILESDISETNDKLNEMKQVVQVLESDETDQLARQLKIQDEIADVQRQIDEESFKRSKVQEEINLMQKSYLGLKKGDVGMLKVISEKAEKAIIVSNQPSGGTGSSAAGSVDTKQMTRVEREMELLNLKKQLEIEKGEVKRLREIAEQAKLEVARALEMASQGNQDKGKHFVPTWVKLLNEHTKRSETIRVHAKKKAKDAVESGDVMSFKDKLLFFTSAPLEPGSLKK